MAIRRIRRIGEEILREKCEDVTVIDNRTRQILNNMVDTLHSTGDGVAIAAPQIGILKRLIVVDMGQGPIKLINPQIIKKVGTQIVIEGCLSIPHTFGKVKRPAKVTVLAFNEHGRKVILTGTGDLAKCFCHEIDHLDGILFTDLVIQYV
jgi:peptide deformylase